MYVSRMLNYRTVIRDGEKRHVVRFINGQLDAMVTARKLGIPVKELHTALKQHPSYGIRFVEANAKDAPASKK